MGARHNRPSWRRPMAPLPGRRAAASAGAGAHIAAPQEEGDGVDRLLRVGMYAEASALLPMRALDQCGRGVGLNSPAL